MKLCNIYFSKKLPIEHSSFDFTLAKKEEWKCLQFRRIEQASFWNNDSDHSNSPMISWCNAFGARSHAVYSRKFVCIRKINLYLLSKNLAEVIFVLKVAWIGRLDCQRNHNGLIYCKTLWIFFQTWTLFLSVFLIKGTIFKLFNVTMPLTSWRLWLWLLSWGLTVTELFMLAPPCSTFKQLY